MLSFNSPIKEEKKYNDLKIVEIEPTIKINLRSNKREFSTKIGKILSILPPNEANTSSGNENYNLLWLSPDEWLVYSNNINHTLDNQIELENNLLKNQLDEQRKINAERDLEKVNKKKSKLGSGIGSVASKITSPLTGIFDKLIASAALLAFAI